MGTAPEPIIPPNVRAQMQYLGLNDDEVYGAFNSSVRQSGPTSGTTVGIADYTEKTVTVVYYQDPDTLDWIIIGVSVINKKAK